MKELNRTQNITGVDALYLILNMHVNNVKVLMISTEWKLKQFAEIRVTHYSLGYPLVCTP